MKSIEPLERNLESIGLHERKRVARLRTQIDAHDLKPGAVVAHCRATGTAEQIEQLGPLHVGSPA